MLTLVKHLLLISTLYARMIMAKLQGTRLGAFRAYRFAALIFLAGFLFGYDTGIVGKCSPGEKRGVRSQR